MFYDHGSDVGSYDYIHQVLVGPNPTPVRGLVDSNPQGPGLRKSG